MGNGENTMEHLIYVGHTTKCFICASNLILPTAIQWR